MYELSKLYPAIAGTQPEYGWIVPVSMASDGFVCIGPHRNYPHHLFAFGSGHNGVASAHLAARVLLRQYLGAPTRATSCSASRACWARRRPRFRSSTRDAVAEAFPSDLGDPSCSRGQMETPRRPGPLDDPESRIPSKPGCRLAARSEGLAPAVLLARQ